MLPFEGGIKDPSGVGICWPQKYWGASWAFVPLDKMAVTFPLSLVFILFCAVGWEEKEPSGRVCPSRKCRPWWGSCSLVNIHIYHFFICPIWSTSHPIAARIKKLLQGPWYPQPFGAPGICTSFWMCFVHFVIGLNSAIAPANSYELSLCSPLPIAIIN